MNELGLKHLIGTPLLRGYMHGFFVSQQLYHRVKAIAQPFAYGEWRKQKVAEKVAEKAQSRIGYKEHALLPKVNKELAQRLLDPHRRKAGGGGDDDNAYENGAADSQRGRKKVKCKKDGTVNERGAISRKKQQRNISAKNPLGDDRFAAMFESRDFEVDKDSEEYRVRFPNGEKQAKRRGVFSEDDDDDDDVETTGVARWDEDDSGDEAIRSAFGIGGVSRAAMKLGAGGVSGGGDSDSDDDCFSDDDDDNKETDLRRSDARRFVGYSDDEDDEDEDEEMPLAAKERRRKKAPSEANTKEEEEKEEKKKKKKKKKNIDGQQQERKNESRKEGVRSGDEPRMRAIGGGEDAIGLFMGTSDDRKARKRIMEDRARTIAERINSSAYPSGK